jgi:catechol 2,3-dioxygenase-like lactoylglutathione lyase family enzyme
MASAIGLQHVALRVANIDRATAFYRDALGGSVRTRPVLRSGRFVEHVLGGPSGVQQLGCHVSFGQGGIELIEVPAPRIEVAHDPRWRRPVLHVCIQVDDVRVSARRVEASGGRLLFPVNEETGRAFVYCEDPDGHVLELVEMTFDEAVTAVTAFVPGADPEGNPSTVKLTGPPTECMLGRRTAKVCVSPFAAGQEVHDRVRR